MLCRTEDVQLTVARVINARSSSYVTVLAGSSSVRYNGQLVIEIVCTYNKQAVLEMMESDDRETPSEFKDIFTGSDGIIVKGVIFFGTPFKGSFLADLTKPLATLLRRDTSFLSRLRREDKQIKQMLNRFDELRLQPEDNIPIRIFNERKPVKKILLKFKVRQTTRDIELVLMLFR